MSKEIKADIISLTKLIIFPIASIIGAKAFNKPLSVPTTTPVKATAITPNTSISGSNAFSKFPKAFFRFSKPGLIFSHAFDIAFLTWSQASPKAFLNFSLVAIKYINTPIIAPTTPVAIKADLLNPAKNVTILVPNPCITGIIAFICCTAPITLPINNIMGPIAVAINPITIITFLVLSSNSPKADTKLVTHLTISVKIGTKISPNCNFNVSKAPPNSSKAPLALSDIVSAMVFVAPSALYMFSVSLLKSLSLAFTIANKPLIASVPAIF